MLFLAAVLSVTTALLSASAYYLCSKYLSFDTALVPAFYFGAMAILAGQYLVLARLDFSKLRASFEHLMLYDRFRTLRS